MCLFVQGRPGLASHGLGDERASWRRPPRHQGGAQRPRKHPEGAAGQGVGLERRRKHQNSWSDLGQHGPTKELRGRDSASVPSHHLAGVHHVRIGCCCCCCCSVAQWCRSQTVSPSMFLSRSSVNSSVETQNQLQNRRRKTCSPPLKAKTRCRPMQTSKNTWWGSFSVGAN